LPSESTYWIKPPSDDAAAFSKHGFNGRLRLVPVFQQVSGQVFDLVRDGPLNAKVFEVVLKSQSATGQSNPLAAAEEPH
jgi:hypothetical protein